MGVKSVNNKWYIITGILVIMIFGMGAVIISLNSKVKSLSQNHNELKMEKDKMLLESGKLQNELSSKNQLVKSKDTEFSNYKDALKSYVSTQKVILDDAQAILGTVRERDELVRISTDYNKHKLIVDRYESQLNVMKDHIEELRDTVNKHKTILAEIGIDSIAELERMDDALPLYDKILVQTKDYLETLK